MILSWQLKLKLTLWLRLEYIPLISTSKHVSKLRYRAHAPTFCLSSTFHKVNFYKLCLWILEEQYEQPSMF